MDTRWLMAAALLTLQPLAHAEECDAYPDMLDACETYQCSFTHPFTGKPMKREIIGPQADGNCLTREQMPGNMLMECSFDEPYRKNVAGFVRKTQAAKQVSTKARISGVQSEVTTRLDKKPVQNPLQEAMKLGLCKVIMPSNKGNSVSTPPVEKPVKKPEPVKTPVPHNPPVQAANRSGSARARASLPDLAVEGVELDDRCRPVITLENRGRGAVPASAYDRGNSAGIQLYKNGRPWQGVALFGFDRTRTLMRPGGSASFTLFQALEPNVPTEVGIVADSRDQIRETTKINNRLDIELTCAR
ncbi:MAG: hypothetical protein ABW131_06755 [Candidatus Sedimenticola sp. 6PFRAG5]